MSTPRVLEPECEWTASDFADDDTFTEHFTASELDELDQSLRHALQRSSDPLDLTRDDFPLPGLAPRLAEIERELIDGRGFVRLRGIDRDAYRQDEMELLYWGIGAHLGRPWAQNKHGHVLGDVTDQGKAPDDPTARGNEFGAIALPFHCDGSDLVGLMCLANGRAGGLSLVSNSVRIHNRLVREEPELATELYGWFPYDFRAEQPDGGASFYRLPVFTEWEDRLFVRCIPGYIWASQRHADAPRLTDTQVEALRAVERMAAEPDNHVAMDLLPGDIQFINNFHVFHGRTAYEDRAGHNVRHLKRLWLETSVLTSRPSYFANRSHWESRRSTSRMRVNAES
ncbi:MAG TPA: TauD/TfdA family dioxygenase [Acidimicrobiales bacterium]|jgi:alpha-ketoglutarate-dependent taurine dioxygenase|nr:TauD/TfdA family dioxygenase [Acidimicrobiales bacterium]